MANQGRAELDAEFRWAVVRLYWQLTTYLSTTRANLSPDERLTVTAVEIGRLDPRRIQPFSLAELAAFMAEADSTIRDRVDRLVGSDDLVRVNGRIVVARPESMRRIYATLARLLHDNVTPAIETIRKWRPHIGSPNLPDLTLDGDGVWHDDIYIDGRIQYELASLFFVQSKYMERKSGMDALDRLIVLTVESRRLDPRLSGSEGPSMRSIHRSANIPKSTTDDRVQSLLERGFLIRRDDGLDGNGERLDQLYNAIVELFIARAEPVVQMISARRRSPR